MKFLKPTIYASIFLASLLVTFDHAYGATNNFTADGGEWNTAGNGSNCGGVVRSGN